MSPDAQNSDFLAQVRKLRDCLRSVDFLYQLKVDELDKLMEVLKKRQCPAGYTVIKQGDPGDAFYMIASGKVEVTADGKHVTNRHEGEARICVRLGDLEQADGKPGGGESWYKRVFRLSRQNKPGDYTLGGLMGFAVLFHLQGRKMEALHLALLCEKALAMGMMPASEPEFHADLGKRLEDVMSQVRSRVLTSVVEDARDMMTLKDPRALLRECLEKY